MPLITPDIEETTTEIPNCSFCKKPLYFGPSEYVIGISVDKSYLEPTTAQAISSTVELHAAACQLIWKLQDTIIPYYICVRLDDFKSTAAICHDCWENFLLDLLSLLEPNERGKIRVLLTNKSTWWKHIGLSNKEGDIDRSDEPGSGEDK